MITILICIVLSSLLINGAFSSFKLKVENFYCTNLSSSILIKDYFSFLFKSLFKCKCKILLVRKNNLANIISERVNIISERANLISIINSHSTGILYIPLLSINLFVFIVVLEDFSFYQTKYFSMINKSLK